MSRFEGAIASAFRLRNSVLAEVLLIAFVCLVGVSVFWRQYVVLTTATWYATPTAAGMTLSRTGVWYAYVSLALFQFLLMRWYFRIFIWARFLWHVSRIELSLIPTHPDRVGGLGFLANTVYAFVPLAVAHGALLAGLIANRIFYLGPGCSTSRSRWRSSWRSCCAWYSAHSWCSRLSSLGRSEREAASMARSRSGMSASSMPSGCAAEPPPTSVWWERRHPVPRRSGE